MATLQIFFSVLGAVGGGFLGAFFAIRKHRSERAFDRRMEWYERTIRVLRDREISLNAQFRGPGKTFRSLVDPWDTWIALLKQLRSEIDELMSEVDLYGDYASWRELLQLSTDLQFTKSLTTKREPDKQSGDFTDWVESVYHHGDKITLKVSEVRTRITTEARYHLGYESMFSLVSRIARWRRKHSRTSVGTGWWS